MLAHPDKLKKPHAPLVFVFLAQCIDHGIALVLSAIIILGGLSALSNAASTTPLHAPTGAFWFGLVLLLFLTSLSYRFIFSMLWGSTLGASLMGLSTKTHFRKKNFWRGHAFESAELAIPLLWAIDVLLRLTDAETPGLRYEFHYQS